jgi:hypothetical protein
MTHVVSTPRRIPIINFSDEADYGSLDTIAIGYTDEQALKALANLGILSLVSNFHFQVEVDNSDVLDGKVPNDYLVGSLSMNGDDTLTVNTFDDAGNPTGKSVTVHLDNVIAITYL